jgi:hypothetical protein
LGPTNNPHKLLLLLLLVAYSFSVEQGQAELPQ